MPICVYIHDIIYIYIYVWAYVYDIINMRTCTVMAAARCANRSVLMASSNIYEYIRMCVYIHNVTHIYVYVCVYML